MKSVLRLGLPFLLSVLFLLMAIRPAAEKDQAATLDDSDLLRPSVAVIGLADWLEGFRATPESVDLAAGVEIAERRREWMSRLIEEDPKRALQVALSASERDGVPEEILRLLEVPISAGGEFEMIVTCHLDGLRGSADRSSLTRFVTIGDERYRAFTFGRRSEMQTKNRISIHGIAVGDALAFYPDPVRKIESADGLVAEAFGERLTFADEGEFEKYVARLVEYETALGPGDGDDGNSNDGLPTAKSAHTEGEKRILYLRVRFADEDAGYEPVSLANAQSRQADVEQHFAVASYGKMAITTVFPDMITLTENKSGYVGQGLGKMMNEARALAITMGQAAGEDWDYNNFDFYVIVSSGGIGGYAGVAQVGGRKSHLQGGNTTLRTAGHEFGHNFGLGHAHFNWVRDLNPRGSTPTDGLTRVEYGHRFSLMSAQSGSDLNHPLIPHFTVHEKWRLDWLTDDDYVDIRESEQTGTYRLFQNDDAAATGLRALRAPSGGELSRYWLSYRTAWRTPNRSSDNKYLLNGIVFDWTGSGGGSSTLLDITPYSNEGGRSGSEWTRDNSDKWDAPLLIGRTYTDSETNLSVTPVARGGSAPDEYIDVYVHLNGGAKVELVAEDAGCLAVVPDAATAVGTEWAGIDFDAGSWPHAGRAGVGYDENSEYLPFIDLDVENTLKDENGSCYIRVPFMIDASLDLAEVEGLLLAMRYDDGFVAYINGIEVAQANAPDPVVWNSRAERLHNDGDAVGFEEFSADDAIGALVIGVNVLAIHGLNESSGSSDFLIQPKLDAVLSPPVNTRPSVTLTADTLLAGVGQDVTLTASGVDPDGDPLAYAWDFDIGDDFAPEGLNNQTAVRGWGSEGIYAVTVTCSDMKGGIARERLVVKVGSPSDSAIVRGRVLRAGQPVEGARVFIDGTDTGSITLANGSYVLAGLDSSDALNLGAMLDGEIFQSSVPMPMVPGDSADGIDFYAHGAGVLGAPAQVLTVSPGTGSTEVSTPVQLSAQLWSNPVVENLFVPFGSEWSYLDTGVDPGANWMDLAFDDSAWSSGDAELGYGDDQVTEIGFGGLEDDKHVTAWFRKSFFVNSVGVVSRLKLSVERDDGVRVFLNGTEVLRDNLTSGTVSAGTEARNEVSGANESAFVILSVDPGLLVEGENILAVDVHQENQDSSDLSFDLEMSAAQNLAPISPVWAVAPAGATVSASGVFVAQQAGVYTITANSGEVSGTSTLGVASDVVVNFSATDGFLWENGSAESVVRVSRSGSTTNALTVPIVSSGEAVAGVDVTGVSDSVTISSGATFAEFSVVVVDDADAEGREYLRVSAQAGALFALGDSPSASIAIIDDELVGTFRLDAGGDRAVASGAQLDLFGTVQADHVFVGRGDYWKFDDSGTDFGTSWQAPSFSDSTWQEGDAEFGYGDDDEVTEVGDGGNSNSKQITTYFRRRFYVDDPSVYSALLARLLVDDGAVVYLNGIEVLRENMPAGSIGYETRANEARGGDDETSFSEFPLDPGSLVVGENVIGVEVHQASSTSSDLGFDLELVGSAASLPAGTPIVWEKVAGPGPVSFVDSGRLATGVSFDGAGSYTIGLSIGSGAGMMTDSLLVTVGAVGSGYASWIAGFPVSNADPQSDPDADGHTNLMEFATVTHPGDAGSSGAPELVRDPGASGGWLFSYRRLRESSPGDASGSTGNGYSLYGVSYLVEVSRDISEWQPGATAMAMQQVGSASDNGDGSETVTVRLVPPVEESDSWFARLRVTLE